MTINCSSWSVVIRPHVTRLQHAQQLTAPACPITRSVPSTSSYVNSQHAPDILPLSNASYAYDINVTANSVRGLHSWSSRRSADSALWRQLRALIAIQCSAQWSWLIQPQIQRLPDATEQPQWQALTRPDMWLQVSWLSALPQCLSYAQD